MDNTAGNVIGSKRLWSLIVGAVVMVLVSFVPALADQAEQINTIVLILVGTLIGGFTITDSVEANATAKIEASKAQVAVAQAQAAK